MPFFLLGGVCFPRSIVSLDLFAPWTVLLKTYLPTLFPRCISLPSQPRTSYLPCPSRCLLCCLAHPFFIFSSRYSVAFQQDLDPDTFLGAPPHVMEDVLRFIRVGCRGVLNMQRVYFCRVVLR